MSTQEGSQDVQVKLTNQKAISKPFVWKTQEGKSIAVNRMKTTHLFYALRMIWNHTVAPEHRLINCKKYSDVGQWPVEYRQEAVRALLIELSRRNDIPLWAWAQMVFMRDCAAKHYNQIQETV